MHVRINTSTVINNQIETKNDNVIQYCNNLFVFNETLYDGVLVTTTLGTQ